MAFKGEKPAGAAVKAHTASLSVHRRIASTTSSAIKKGAGMAASAQRTVGRGMVSAHKAPLKMLGIGKKDTRVKPDPRRKAVRDRAKGVKVKARAKAKTQRQEGRASGTKEGRVAGRTAAKATMVASRTKAKLIRASAPQRQAQVGPKAKARAAATAAQPKRTGGRGGATRIAAKGKPSGRSGGGRGRR